MKCQRNVSPYRSCFAARSWSAVLPHDLDAGLGEQRQLVDGDVLRRGDDGHVRAHLLADARVGLRGSPRCQRRAATIPWRPGDGPGRGGARRRAPPRRRCRGRRARPTRSRRRAARARRPRRGRGSCRRRHRARSASRNGVRHLLADLVAAGADARPDRGRERAAAERRHAGLHDALEEPAPADVEDGEARPAVRPRERDRQAVGGEEHEPAVALVGPEPVAALEAASPAGRSHARRRGRPWRRGPARPWWRSPGRCRPTSQSSRRFSTTRSGSSSVRIPRFSDSKGPSLTPPRRDENTTRYGSRAPLRRSWGLDQLPRGGELRVAAVELAVHLAAQDLLEDGPDLGRLASGRARRGRRRRSPAGRPAAPRSSGRAAPRRPRQPRPWP